MAKIINGETYWYVDTICCDEIIYDVYENDRGEHFYVMIDTLY